MFSGIFKTVLPEISSSSWLHYITRPFKIETSAEPVHPPTWDLVVVLRSMCDEEYELTKKTLRGGLCDYEACGWAACSVFASCLSRKYSNVVICYFHEFRAKAETASNPLPWYFVVKALTDSVGLDVEECKLCPMRALRLYLDCYKDLSPVSPSKPLRSISKNALSYFLCECICGAGAVLVLWGIRLVLEHTVFKVSLHLQTQRRIGLTRVYLMELVANRTLSLLVPIWRMCSLCSIIVDDWVPS